MKQQNIQNKDLTWEKGSKNNFYRQQSKHVL